MTFKMYSSLFLLAAIFPTFSYGTYTIVGSKTLRPMSEYHVAVSRSASGSGAVNLELEGRTYKEAQLVTLDQHSTTIVTFKTGALNNENYTLTARSVYGDEFFGQAQLAFNNKTYCVFIQTDKTVYTAKDNIKFRLLVLNMHLKPLASVKPHLTLKDGRGHIVKQWSKVPLNKGVFSDEVQIAEYPVLGDWVFTTELNGQTYTKKILVADFILPKFQVTIEAPDHIYYSDGTFPVTVKAHKFSGEEVEGELTLTAYPVFYSGVIQPVFQTPLRRVEAIKGQASFQLSLNKELQLREGEATAGTGGRRLVLEAAVEEALTGRRQNVSVLLWLHRSKHYLTSQAPKFYKPGLPYTLQAKIDYWEELTSPSVPRDMGTMTIKYGRSNHLEGNILKEEEMTEVKVPVGADGSVFYTFNTEAKQPELPLTIEMLYNDLRKVVSGILPLSSATEDSLQLSLQTPEPAVGKEIVVKVNSTSPMRTLTYVLIGRGDIIFAKTSQIVPARKMDEFKFQATHAMAPEAILMLYHVSESSQLTVTSLKFQVHGIFQNHINLRISPEEPEALGNVDFSVVSEPDSYVALMAGTPSPGFGVGSDHHYGAGQGDGLSQDIVLKEIRSFSGFSEALPHRFQEIEGHTIFETVAKSGVVLLTNNYVKKSNKSGNVGDSESDLLPFSDESTRPPLAGPFAFSRVPPPPSPRVHLGAMPSDTWLFANLTVGSEGRGILGRRLPASPGSGWGAGVWSVHPVKGLSIGALRAPRPTRRPVLRATIPSTLREKEVLALPATVTNPTGVEIEAEITLQNLRQDFRFEEKNEVDSPKALELYQRQKVRVPPGRSGTVVFFISVPTSIEGARTITVQLTSSGVGLADSFEQDVEIIPEGEEESTQTCSILDLNSGSAKANLSLAVMPRIRGRYKGQPLPTAYSALAWGWLLAPVLERLPRLATQPPASGYHNMIPFMEAAVLIQTLDNTGQLSEAVRVMALEQMQKIYQQQLAYLQPDGSFSIQKNQDGSIWVTEYSARWLSAGMGSERRDVGVSASVVRNALHWLAMKQEADGHWQEMDSATQPNENSLQQNTITLTALTLNTFIETKHLTLEEYTNVISKAQDWLARHLEEANSGGPATLAPVAAALATARHPSAFQAVNLLDQVANNTDGSMWWNVNEEDTDNPLRRQAGSGKSAWTSSWAVQAFLTQGLRSEAMRAAKPLLPSLLSRSYPPPLLPALSRLAARIAEGTTTLEYKCPNENDITVLNVNKGNYLLVLRQQVKEKQCEVTGRGTGAVVAAIQGQRRSNATAPWPRFTLDPRIDAVSTQHHLQLTICIGFVKKSGEEISGPVLMKVRLPSGYTLDVDIPALLANGKVRSANQGEVLQLILAPLGPRETCMTLSAPRLHAVANEHPGVITLRDLDDDSRRARVFFSTGNKEMCDVCWGARCKGPCIVPDRRGPLAPWGQVASEEKSSSTSSINTQTSLIICSIIIPLTKFLCNIH